jgi:hypothetical protein
VGGRGVGVGEGEGVGVRVDEGMGVGVEVGAGRVGDAVPDSGAVDGTGVATGEEIQAPRLKAIDRNRNILHDVLILRDMEIAAIALSRLDIRLATSSFFITNPLRSARTTALYPLSIFELSRKVRELAIGWPFEHTLIYSRTRSSPAGQSQVAAPRPDPGRSQSGFPLRGCWSFCHPTHPST